MIYWWLKAHSLQPKVCGNSLARVRGDDEVNVVHVFDRVLQDGVDGHAVFCRQLADSFDDPEVIPANGKNKTEHHKNIVPFCTFAGNDDESTQILAKKTVHTIMLAARFASLPLADAVEHAQGRQTVTRRQVMRR